MSNASNISLPSCCFIFSVCICLHMGLGIGEGSLDKPKEHTKCYKMVKCQLITNLKVVWDVNMTPAWWKFVQLYPGNMLWKITPTRCLGFGHWNSTIELQPQHMQKHIILCISFRERSVEVNVSHDHPKQLWNKHPLATLVFCFFFAMGNVYLGLEVANLYTSSTRTS